MKKAMKWSPSLLILAALTLLAVAPAARAQFDVVIDPDTVQCEPDDCVAIVVGWNFQSGMIIYGECEYEGGPDLGFYAGASTYINANNCNVEILAQSYGSDGETEVESSSQGGYPPPGTFPVAYAFQAVDCFDDVEQYGGGSYPC